MIRLILIMGLIGFAVAIILNIFFTYIPIAQIEKKINQAIEAVEQVAAKTSKLEDKIVNDATEEITKIKNKVCSSCSDVGGGTAAFICVELCLLLGGTPT